MSIARAQSASPLDVPQLLRPYFLTNTHHLHQDVAQTTVSTDRSIDPLAHWMAHQAKLTIETSEWEVVALDSNAFEGE